MQHVRKREAYRSASYQVIGKPQEKSEARISSGEGQMIRKLKTGEFRIYSSKKDKKTGKRKNLGTFPTREKAERHERAIEFFKSR